MLAESKFEFVDGSASAPTNLAAAVRTLGCKRVGSSHYHHYAKQIQLQPGPSSFLNSGRWCHRSSDGEVRAEEVVADLGCGRAEVLASVEDGLKLVDWHLRAIPCDLGE